MNFGVNKWIKQMMPLGCLHRPPIQVNCVRSEFLFAHIYSLALIYLSWVSISIIYFLTQSDAPNDDKQTEDSSVSSPLIYRLAEVNGNSVMNSAAYTILPVDHSTISKSPETVENGSTSNES